MDDHRGREKAARTGLNLPPDRANLARSDAYRVQLAPPSVVLNVRPSPLVTIAVRASVARTADEIDRFRKRHAREAQAIARQVTRPLVPTTQHTFTVGAEPARRVDVDARHIHPRGPVVRGPFDPDGAARRHRVEATGVGISTAVAFRVALNSAVRPEAAARSAAARPPVRRAGGGRAAIVGSAGGVAGGAGAGDAAGGGGGLGRAGAGAAAGAAVGPPPHVLRRPCAARSGAALARCGRRIVARTPAFEGRHLGRGAAPVTVTVSVNARRFSRFCALADASFVSWPASRSPEAPRS